MFRVRSSLKIIKQQLGAAVEGILVIEWRLSLYTKKPRTFVQGFFYGKPNSMFLKILFAAKALFLL